MINFLFTLLTFALGVGAFLNHPAHVPAVTPDDIVSRFEEYVNPLETPQGNPVESFQNGQENQPQHEPTRTQEASGNDDQPESEPATVDNDANPDTTKVAAYNTSSEKVIGSVAAVAVYHAPPLIPYPTEIPIPEPTPTLTPLPVIEPIEPPIPLPTGDPCHWPPGDPRMMRPDIFPCPFPLAEIQ